MPAEARARRSWPSQSARRPSPRAAARSGATSIVCRAAIPGRAPRRPSACSSRDHAVASSRAGSRDDAHRRRRRAPSSASPARAAATRSRRGLERGVADLRPTSRAPSLAGATLASRRLPEPQRGPGSRARCRGSSAHASSRKISTPARQNLHPPRSRHSHGKVAEVGKAPRTPRADRRCARATSRLASMQAACLVERTGWPPPVARVREGLAAARRRRRLRERPGAGFRRMSRRRVVTPRGTRRRTRG